MRKKYQKPAIQAVKIQQQHGLLRDSYAGYDNKPLSTYREDDDKLGDDDDHPPFRRKREFTAADVGATVETDDLYDSYTDEHPEGETTDIFDVGLGNDSYDDYGGDDYDE